MPDSKELMASVDALKRAMLDLSDIRKSLRLAFLQGKDAGIVSADAIVDRIHQALLSERDYFDHSLSKLRTEYETEVTKLRLQLAVYKREINRLQRLDARDTERERSTTLLQ